MRRLDVALAERMGDELERIVEELEAIAELPAGDPDAPRRMRELNAQAKVLGDYLRGRR